MKAERGDEALRRFRVSSPGTDYFLTLNLVDKSGPTLAPAAKQAIRTEIEAIEASGHWHVRGAVIMPDHLHLLVNLGSSLPLSRVVARLKSKNACLFDVIAHLLAGQLLRTPSSPAR